MTPEEIVADLGGVDARRAAYAAYWHIGDLGYRLSQLQQRVRAMVYSDGPRRVGWLASRRAGKSRTNCALAIETALGYPGIYIPYAAATAVQVKTFIDPHFRDMANEAPPELAPESVLGVWTTPPLQWYDAEGNPVRSRLAGGTELARYSGRRRAEVRRQSRIAARGCEDLRKADALRGPGTVLGIVDEARDIPTLDYVISDVLGPMLWEAQTVWGSSVRPKLLITSTAPRQPDHPFVALWAQLQATGSAMHSTAHEADHLTPEMIAAAIEECGGVDTLSWRREGLAIIERDPHRSVFVEFERGKVVGIAPRPSHFFPAVIGDGGFVDLSGYLFGYYDFERATYVVERELGFSRVRSDVQDAAIREMEQELWPDVEVERRMVDAPPQVRADMNRPEWGTPADDEEEFSPPHWRGVAKPRSKSMGSMEAGVNRVRKVLAEGRLEIHESCTTLLEHMDGARWTRARDSFVRVTDAEKEPLHHYDFAAALVYFIRCIESIRNPHPHPSAGFSLPNHMIRKSVLEKEGRDSLAGALSGRRRKRR